MRYRCAWIGAALGCAVVLQLAAGAGPGADAGARAWGVGVAAAERAREGGAAKRRWQTVPPPPAMPRPDASGHVEVAGGARVYWAAYGEPTAPPVILLHGGLGNGDHFAHQVPALAGAYRAIAIDSRGHGRSTLGGAKLSYRAMAEDVVAVMDALGVRRAAVVGWSDGGAIALALGIEHPRRVDRLLVLAANYDQTGARPRGGAAPTFAAYSARCRADAIRLAAGAAGPARATATATGAGAAGAGAAEKAAAAKAFEATTAAMLPVWRDPAPFTKAQLRTIQARTRVVAAEHDELIAVGHLKEMAALIPRGELVVLKDVSHFALWQDPDGFNRVLLELLGAR